MAAARPINTAAIEKGTGKTWQAWLVFLEEIGAAELSHTEIARRVGDTGEASGWWAQSITVAYEQHIGRRLPGQDGDGSFQLSVTKTLPGTMDEAMAAWQALAGRRTDFSGVAIASGPRMSATEKWRRWGATLEDRSRVIASVNQKTPDKAGFAVTHQKLASAEAAEVWRAFWKDFLKAF
ncbi:hypothetical protein [Aquamicrobium sp. LC103]|uniref:hypothetical protein n=1 Tax=Aquamicrobium sp. LC103 TaxID=1120658 RepID=UPI00063E79C7|nr:hypothetical protein [Aquamicrobium sp. LC103]TKT82564.1 hypothetical protein XW59_000965 [Aquamicrobium sp. LC103]